jgi:hypothetical protein
VHVSEPPGEILGWLNIFYSRGFTVNYSMVVLLILMVGNGSPSLYFTAKINSYFTAKIREKPVILTRYYHP